MTIDQMRVLLGLGSSISDEAVVDAYAAYLEASDAGPSEPLTLEEAKLNLRVDVTTDDALIGSLIVAAREYVEDYTGLILTPRVVTETVATLGHWIDLAAWPVTSIGAIRYPVRGVMTELPTGSWNVSFKRRPALILPAQFGWGVGSLAYGGACPQAALPVEIDLAAGFATPADVPATVKQAMHLMIAHLYSNRAAAEVGARAAAIEVPFGVEALLRRWRLVQV